MKDEAIDTGKAAGIWAWVCAGLNWMLAIPLESWVSITAIICAMCATVSYLLSSYKRYLDIRAMTKKDAGGDENE